MKSIKVCFKVVLLLAVIVICIMFSFSKASALLSYEFFPQGVNYLDPENINYFPSNVPHSGTIKTIRPFRVRNGTTYKFYTTEYQEVFYGDGTIIEYDQSHVEIGSAEITRFRDGDFIAITTSPTTYYISFIINVNCIENSHVNISAVDEMYIMVEDIYTDAEVYDMIVSEGGIEYEGADYGLLQEVGATCTIETSVSNPISYKEINTSVLVYDLNDGIITSNKELVLCDYDASTAEVGIYSIIYKVVNSLGVESQLNITVSVTDDVLPSIDGDDTFTMYSTNLKTIEDIKNSLTAFDNADGVITDRITVKTDNFTNRDELLGTTQVVFSVRDNAQNEVEFVVNVIVLQGDITGPVFGGQEIFSTTTTEPLTINSILSQITCIDDYSGDVHDRIVVIKDEYSYNKTKRGLYNIYLSVTDDVGNTTYKTLVVNVNDMTKPVFVINTSEVYLPLDFSINSYRDVISFLQKTDYIANNMEVTIVYENYIENKNTLGAYQVVLESDDKKYNFTFNVISDDEYKISSTLDSQNVNRKNKGLFTNIKDLFNNIGRSIKSFFSRFFDRLF